MSYNREGDIQGLLKRKKGDFVKMNEECPFGEGSYRLEKDSFLVEDGFVGCWVAYTIDRGNSFVTPIITLNATYFKRK